MGDITPTEWIWIGLFISMGWKAGSFIAAMAVVVGKALGKMWKEFQL